MVMLGVLIIVAWRKWQQRWMLSVALVLLLGVFWRVFTIPPAGPPAAPPAGESRR